MDLLTSKEIIERTGISRATLNNYIATGLVARPQVLAPNAEDSAAPRIGYFPDQGAQTLSGVDLLVLAGGAEPVTFFGYPGIPSRLAPEGCEAVV